MTAFFLLHCLKAWILPPGLNILLALIGLLLYFFNRTIAYCLILVSVCTLWLLSAPIFVYACLDNLQNKYAFLSQDSLTHPLPRSAIVVLGGGDTVYVELGGQQGVSELTLNRLRYGAYLHRKMHLPIIVSGGSVNGAKQSGASLMGNSLHDDFNVTNTIKEDKSINTKDESEFLVPILRKHHFDTIYLVTHAWHMPRSIYLFEKQNIHVLPAPMGYEKYDRHYTLLSFLPNMHALRMSSILINELVGMMSYH